MSSGLSKLLCGDASVVIREQIPPASVHLCCTSPPYNCGKDYGVSNDHRPWDDYWEWTEDWLSAVYSAVVSGGRLAVNLPWWMGKKPRRSVPFEFQKVAERVGWLFLDKITWAKGGSSNLHTSGGWGGGGCGWGTYLSPSGPSIRCASEPILIFSKERRGRGVVSGQGRGACIRGDMTPEEWHQWTLDVWFMRGGL